MKPALGTVLGSAVAVAVAVAALAASAPAGVERAHGKAAQASGLRIVSTIGLDSAPTDLIAASGSLWASLGREEIVRIDPETNRIVARIQPGGVGLAAGFGAVWAFDILAGEVLRIDSGTNRVTRRIQVGGLPTGIAVGHGSLWVANQLDSTVSRISPGRAGPSQGSNWISAGSGPAPSSRRPTRSGPSPGTGTS